MRITPIILAGGEGRRLFPISTPLRPKPFVPLAGGLSLLARTLQRVATNAFAPPMLIGSATHRFALLNHARDAGVEPQSILLEQEGHNTALAVALAVAATKDDDTMLALLPADHFIADEAAWRHALQQLAQALGNETLGLLGQHVAEHNPHFGYMVAQTGAGAQPVHRFIEKPEQPPTLPEGTTLLCNLGQFVGTRRAFMHAFETHAPNIWHMACDMVARAQTEYEFTRLPAPEGAVPPSAFDRVVLENCTTLLAAGCQAGWEDLGSKAAWNHHQGALPMAPPRVDRPWGHFTVLAYSEVQVEKRLLLYPGCRISLQRHQQREEHWHIATGTAHIVCGDDTHVLSAGERITIPKGAWHRLANMGDAPLEVMEMQIGTPDEADIERREDDYGRAGDNSVDSMCMRG